MGYKSYTAEYKTKVVLEVLREEKPLGETASSYGLNPNMVRNWKTDFLAKASSVFENPEKAAKKAKRKEEAHGNQMVQRVHTGALLLKLHRCQMSDADTGAFRYRISCHTLSFPNLSEAISHSMSNLTTFF